MSASTGGIGTVTYELEIEIEAPRASVWKALTAETNAWWLADFHMVGENSVVTLDASAGGLLVERAPDGGSLLWYTVHMCTPGESLHLYGHTAPDWGGPNTSLLRLALEDRGAGTALLVRDSIYGHVADSTTGQQKDGWRQLFEDGLKRYVESR